MAIIADKATELESSEFIREATTGKLGSQIYFQCKSIYPLKGVEIQKSRILAPVVS